MRTTEPFQFLLFLLLDGTRAQFTLWPRCRYLRRLCPSGRLSHAGIIEPTEDSIIQSHVARGISFSAVRLDNSVPFYSNQFWFFDCFLVLKIDFSALLMSQGVLYTFLCFYLCFSDTKNHNEIPVKSP